MRTADRTIESVISVDDLAKESNSDGEQARHRRLQLFAKANPDDIRIKPSLDYIIFAVTMKQLNQTANGITLTEEWFPVDELKGTDPSKLMAEAFLTTEKGKRIPLARYEDPRDDRLGAKLYFPRLRPDGRPSVSLEDKQIELEFPILDKKITAKFDLGMLLYRGRLEL